MKWVIVPFGLTSLMGGAMLSNSLKENFIIKPLGETCSDPQQGGFCNFQSCFSGYTCGGGGMSFTCSRFAGNVIDP